MCVCGWKVCAVLGRVEEGGKEVGGEKFVEGLRNLLPYPKEAESIGSKDPFTSQQHTQLKIHGHDHTRHTIISHRFLLSLSSLCGF